MAELVCDVPVPASLSDLEQAIHHYRTHDLTGTELFCYWQAIRDASLEHTVTEPEPAAETELVPGEDSY